MAEPTISEVLEQYGKNARAAEAEAADLRIRAAKLEHHAEVLIHEARTWQSAAEMMQKALGASNG